MSRITKQTTLDEFIFEARRLRSFADEAEADFLAYLYEAERVPSLWRGTGYTFLQFLEQSNLCRPTRYAGYKSVRDGLGMRAIANVGVHAVVAAGRFQDPQQQQQILEEARIWEKTNGTAISEQSAGRLAHDQRTRVQVARVGHRSYVTLAKDLVAAEAEIERLEAENMALREENKLLREGIMTSPPVPPERTLSERKQRRQRAPQAVS